MRIRSVASRHERIDLTRPYAIAGQPPVVAVDTLLVELHADHGVLGLGSATPAPDVTNETFAACARALSQESLGWLEGRDLRTLATLGRELAQRLPGAPAARAAVDMALHDACARALGLPLTDLLGRVHRSMPTSITIGILPLDATLAAADEHLGRGFRILKLKIGDDLESDVERVTRLRERVGRGVVIRVDANQGYSPAETIAFCERTAGLDLELLEQPLAADDPGSLRRLPPDVRARIAADESLRNDRDALLLATPEPACGAFNVKLMKCGGIAPALRIASIADAAQVALMWGCMDESVIGIAAALHAAFACPATRYLDLDGSFDLARDTARGGFVLHDGRLATADEPGLGVWLDGRRLG